MNKNRDEELIEALSPVTPQRLREIACVFGRRDSEYKDLHRLADQLERQQGWLRRMADEEDKQDITIPMTDPATVECSWCHGTLLRRPDQLERNAEVLSQCKYFVDMAASTHPSATVRKSALILSERLLPAPPEERGNRDRS